MSWVDAWMSAALLTIGSAMVGFSRWSAVDKDLSPGQRLVVTFAILTHGIAVIIKGAFYFAEAMR